MRCQGCADREMGCYEKRGLQDEQTETHEQSAPYRIKFEKAIHWRRLTQPAFSEAESAFRGLQSSAIQWERAAPATDLLSRAEPAPTEAVCSPRQ